MAKEYRFTHRKGRNIEVLFRHMPGRWISTGTNDMTEAVLFAESKMRDVSSDREDITLGKFAKNFFGPKDPHGYRHRNERRNVFYSDHYYQAHQSRLDNYILPAHGKFLLGAINDVMIEDFILDLTSFRDGKELDDSTKNKVLAAYRIVLDAAVREGYMDNNPAKNVKEINERRGGRLPFTEEEMDSMFPEDDEKLISIWYNLKWACYFCVLKDTGWRPGEAAALAIKNFFPHMSGSVLNGVYTEEEVSWKTHKIIKRIKTSDKSNGAKNKQGFVTDQTARLLTRLAAECDGEYFFEMSEEDNVFSHRRKDHGTQYIYAELANDRLEMSAKAAGVELDGRTQYCFRHTWNTFYIGRLPEVARLLLMGHHKNRPEYTHLTPVQSLERVLNIDGFKEAMGIEEDKNKS